MVEEFNKAVRKATEDQNFFINIACFASEKYGLTEHVYIEGKGSEQINKSLWDIGMSAKVINAHEVIILVEVSMVHARTGDVKGIDINDITNSPSTMPKGIRKDGLLTLRIELATGDVIIYFQEFERICGEINFLDKDIVVFDKTKQAQVGGSIIETVLKGYSVDVNRIVDKECTMSDNDAHAGSPPPKAPVSKPLSFN